MTLHTINLNNESANIQRCFALLATGDAVIFLARGVDCVRTDNALTKTIESLARQKQIDFFALEEDLNDHSLKQNLPGGVINIDYTKFVQLVAQNEKTVSWY